MRARRLRRNNNGVLLGAPCAKTALPVQGQRYADHLFMLTSTAYDMTDMITFEHLIRS